MAEWDELLKRAQARYEDGRQRLPEEPDARQRQLTRLGNAAGAAALCALMAGGDGREWFVRAAESYRESWEHAPPDSWGRPIGAVKARILAGDWEGAAADARWTLAERPDESDSPIGRYAAALARLVLEDDTEAAELAAALAGEQEEAFPRPVAEALAGLAARDRDRYAEAVGRVLESFETREAYLEDVPVADTVIVLEALAARRGLGAGRRSVLLPD